MKSSARILDQNLERLLTRSWTPVQPRVEFVRELQSALAPWIAEADSAPAPARIGAARPPRWPWIAAGFAAAALLLLLARWLPDFSGGGSQPGGNRELASLETLLEAGEVALRSEAGGAWRAASDTERSSGIRHAGGHLELATPEQSGVALFGAEGWTLALQPRSALVVTPAEGGLDLALQAGTAQASNGRIEREIVAPQLLSWREGDFVDASGLSWSSVALGPKDDLGSDREELSSGPGREGEEDTEPEAARVPTAILAGRVRGAEDEQPIAVFEVSILKQVALPQVSFPDVQTYESSSGEFRWEGIEPGSYSVFVSVQGSAIWKSAQLELVGGEVLAIDVEVEVGGSLRGFVIDAETGAAIEGALIVSEEDMPLQVISLDQVQLPPTARAFTHSRRDGSFELVQVNRGAQRLRASGPGFAPTWVDVQLRTPSLDGIVFELTPGGAVEGRCEHADGSPLTGAQVIVSRFSTGAPGSKMTFARTLTDEKGQYAVEHLAAGLYVVLLFSEQEAAPRYQPRYKPVAVKEAERVRVDFLGEARGASVSGVVRDAQGQPLGYTSVQLWSHHDGGMDWIGETTDAQGRYEIIGQDPGPYQLYAGSAESMILYADLELAEGEHIERDVVVEGLTLEARVKDLESGQPVGFVDFFLVQGGPSSERLRIAAHAFSRADGAVVFEHVPAGEYSLLVVPETGLHAWSIHPDVRVDAASESPVLELQLERACRATLEVTDPAGRPLAGARVRIVSPVGETWDRPWTPRCDEQGQIELECLRAGNWTYDVQLEGFEGARGVFTAKAGDGSRTRVILQPR